MWRSLVRAGGGISQLRRWRDVMRQHSPQLHSGLSNLKIFRTARISYRAATSTLPLRAASNYTQDSHARSTDTQVIAHSDTHLIVKTRSHVLHSPPMVNSCPRCRPHMPSACPPVRSQSHVMFHNSARADEATSHEIESPRPSGSAQIQLPRPGMSVLHVREHHATTTARSPPRDSHFERTCDAWNSRTSHVATRFTLGPPRMSEGFLPLPQSTFESF
jgi:hypothetical protein